MLNKNSGRERSHPFDAVLSLPYEQLSLLWTFATLSFAAAYFFLSYLPGEGPSGLFSILDPVSRFLDSLYFSVITATSTGYGDVVPLGFSRFFAALQSIGSVIIIALFVAKFAARKQEIALENIHELSFDSAFHSIREGLFIARKDLDAVIQKVVTKEELNPKDWRNLYISFHQMQIFIRQIPTLYNVKHRSLSLDIDRERLLLDAIERTLRRVLESLAIFEEENVKYQEHAGCMKELSELSLLVGELFAPQKEKTADIENREAFDEILARAGEIRVIVKHG